MDMEGYVRELLEEKDLLDTIRSANSTRLLEEEIERVRLGKEPSTMSAVRKARLQEEIITLAEKVFLPVEEFPGVNFVGKILGPKGRTLKGIQASTQSKISILGYGSTRDSRREEELCQSDDPQYAHFKEPLHILIQIKAPKSDAHARLAAALQEIKICMESGMDEIRPDDQPLIIDNRYSRGGCEERQKNRTSSIPRNTSPRSNAYDKYGSSHHSAVHERYPKTKDSLHYDDRYDNNSFRRAEKRPAKSGDYATKKYRGDSHRSSHRNNLYRPDAF